MKLDNYIRAVPDFPVRGVLFRDLTPMMADHAALQEAVRQLVAPFLSERIDMVAGVEARGLIFGVLAAAQLGTGFMPLRKLGKLPGPVESVNYQLEYGDACLQAQRNTLAPGSRVLIVDDVLATGGTLVAASELVARLGVEVVGLAVIMELVALRGRPRLSAHRLHSVMTA